MWDKKTALDAVYRASGLVLWDKAGVQITAKTQKIQSKKNRCANTMDFVNLKSENDLLNSIETWLKLNFCVQTI